MEDRDGPAVAAETRDPEVRSADRARPWRISAGPLPARPPDAPVVTAGVVTAGTPAAVSAPVGEAAGLAGFRIDTDGAPADHLVPALLAAVFCFPPTGVAGIMHALRARSLLGRGDARGASVAAVQARRFALVSVPLGGLLYLGVFLLAFVIGAA